MRGRSRVADWPAQGEGTELGGLVYSGLLTSLCRSGIFPVMSYSYGELIMLRRAET